MLIDASLLHRAAADAAGGQQYPAGTLYLVATPIGNLADVSLRAVHLLGLVDAVACEDTRVGGGLLRLLGLQRPLLAVHAHNEREGAAAVLARLGRGERVAYLSDAGTPAVSDPGAVLVAEVTARGHRCIPLPGPSSALAALSVAGDARGQAFRCVGFLGSRGADRRGAIAALAADLDTQVVFEAPHRIAQLARELAEAVPARTVTVARELTKQFETIATMRAAEVPDWLAADANRARGEFVLVLHALPQAASQGLDAGLERWLVALLEALPLKQAVALAANASGAPRKLLYARALELRQPPAGGDAGPAEDAAEDEAADEPGAVGPDGLHDAR